jgi:hypothetical protein
MSALTRVFDALWRNVALQTRDRDVIPDQRCTASLRCALHRIREKCGGLHLKHGSKTWVAGTSPAMTAMFWENLTPLFAPHGMLWPKRRLC